MKIYIFLICFTFCALVTGVFVPPRPGHKKHNLGTKQCTWGPSYWCQNLTAAADCHAVKHCIQTDWLHRTLPPDNSSVCQICLDMVKQARDQLESNETQELIKEVFEGECALLRIKPIVKECDKIADNYIPDLIDTLASQMNPQIVCSVAGLCNSEKVQKLIKDAQAEENVSTDINPVKSDKCQGCHTVMAILEDRFNKMSRDDVLHSLLKYCGKFGSFSDGCSNIVITYFTEIYQNLQAHFNSMEVCLLSGECSAQFHNHRARVEITPNSHIGYVPVSAAKDDLPCELCEQLVQHLRDLLVANTTEDEFKQVLIGFCKQTGQFATECTELVNQYYAEIYNFLTEHLNSTEVCDDIGICHLTDSKDVMIAPLLPVTNVKKALELSSTEDKQLVHINLHSDQAGVRVLPDFNVEQQLPIDLMLPHTQILYNKEVCEFCEYFLHYVQEALTEPKTEEEIKKFIEEVCNKLPNVVNDTCVDFVDNYEPALVAILAQQIDPSQVCPLIRACPSSDNHDVEVFMEAKSDSKCPLCLIAITKLEDMIKNNKSEAQIEAALQKVCKALPQTIDNECEDLVKTYTKEIIEMLLNDFEPQEVCVALKLCSDSRPASPLPHYVVKHVEGNIETNVIPDNTINGHVIDNESTDVGEKPQCVLCEFIMKEIEDQLKENTTDEEIKKIVTSICSILPSSIRKECDDFIEKNANTIIQLLIAALEPAQICRMMGLCDSGFETIRVEILECPICEMTVEVMAKILANPKVDHNVEHVIEKTCRGLPLHYRSKCTYIVETYGDMLIKLLIDNTDKDLVCKKIGYCKSLMTEVVID